MDERTQRSGVQMFGRRRRAACKTIVLHSCGATWHFQPARMRFRRRLEGIGEKDLFTGWHPYFGLEFEPGSEGFVVLLDPGRARTIRSRLHRSEDHSCGDCADGATADRPIDRLLHLVA